MNAATKLRERIHGAIDEALDDFFGSSSRQQQERIDAGLVLENPKAGPFSHRWPPKNGEPDIESFHRSVLFRVSAGEGRFIRLGWTSNREAWGRKRERAVAFLETPSEHRYPLIEFVETDDRKFAAIIPDPKKPRSACTDPNDLPERFRAAIISRTDELFGGVKNGPTLRLVLAFDDEADMAGHGLWVGRLRGHI